ncbi:MAG: restriction endonuclease [Microvirga sp.]|nr:restriction endonuclease [Microvirga sp.]
MSDVYNPLDKINLARSIELELLRRPPAALSDIEDIKGAGVYVIYYTGVFPAYAVNAAVDPTEPAAIPIYIGKAIPKGGRKGGVSKRASAVGVALRDRLRQHATSIDECANLDLADFKVRYLVVDDIWIPLGENMLIERFKPVWNRAIDGFGNKDPGKRRKTQMTSPWDVLHPGRKAAVNTTANPELTTELLLQRIDDHFSGRPLTKLPKAVEEQQAEEQAAAEEAADEA